MGLSGKRFSTSSIESTQYYCIFLYSIRHLSKTNKIRFYYALKGRDGKSGFVSRTKSQHLGKSVLLTPIIHDNETQEFLGYWKCNFERKEVMILDNGKEKTEDG